MTYSPPKPITAADAPASPAEPSMLDQALALARRGFHVFPLEPNGVVPLPGSHGHLDATRDPEEIKRLWSDPIAGPMRYNIGISPRDGRHVFVDLDEKENRGGIGNFLALGGEIGGLVVRTKSNGLHVVYSTDRDLRTNAGELARGVDVRGPNGFCVGPGSRVGDKVYEIVQDDPPLPAPAWLVERLSTPRRAAAVTTVAIEPDLAHNVARAVEAARTAPPAISGIWHDLGFRLGAEMARIGLSAEKAIEVLAEHWVPRGSGFKSPDQFRKDVTGGYDTAVGDGQHGVNSIDAAAAAFADVRIIPPDEADAAAARSPAGSRLRLVSVQDCAASPTRRYVVKTMISAGDVVLIIGPPGAGKSTITPLIAYSIARGVPVFDRRTRQGGVLYVAAEDSHGMRARVHALQRRHGGAEAFHMVDGITDLFNASGEAEDLVALVRWQKPGVVVVDTIAAAWPGLKENESSDMGRVVDLARRLATDADGQPGPAVILVHHVPKSERGDESTPRGHGSLNGAADVVLRLSPDATTRIVTMTFGKNRNGASFGEAMAFRIESEAIGVDEDGDRVTAPIAVVLNGVELAKAEKLTASERELMRIFQDLIDDNDVGVSRDNAGSHFGVPMGGKIGVQEDKLREACDARGLSNAKTKKARTQKFTRLVAGLVQKKVVSRLFGMLVIEDVDASPE